MDMKIVIIIGFSYLYGFFEVFMNLRQRGKTSVTASGDKGSLWLLYILITVGYALSFSIGATRTGRMNHWDAFFAVGVVLALTGLMIRVRSILTLKQYFTYSVAQAENHKLIETGLYKFIRHPDTWAIDDIRRDLDFIVELVGSSIHDDSGYDRVYLPNKGGRRLYDRTNGRKLLELSKTDKKNHPNDLTPTDGIASTSRRRATDTFQQA